MFPVIGNEYAKLKLGNINFSSLYNREQNFSRYGGSHGIGVERVGVINKGGKVNLGVFKNFQSPDSTCRRFLRPGVILKWPIQFIRIQ